MKKLNKLCMPIIAGSMVGASLPLAILTGCSCHNTPVEELEIDDNLVYKQNYGYVETVLATNGACYLQGFYLSTDASVEDLSVEVLNLKGIENPSTEVEIVNNGYNFFDVNIYFKSTKSLKTQYAKFDIKISNKNNKTKTFTGFEVYNFDHTLIVGPSTSKFSIGTTTKSDTYDYVMNGVFLARKGSDVLFEDETKKLHVTIKTLEGEDVTDITPTILIDEDPLMPQFRIKLSFTNFQAQKNKSYYFIFRHEDLANWSHILKLQLSFFRTEDQIFDCKYDETNLKATLCQCYCSDDEIVIPDEIKHNGKTYKITSIAPKDSSSTVFSFLPTQKIVFGDNITNIAKSSDYKCHNLKTIKIGKNATFDDKETKEAPFQSSAIENIVIDPANPYITSNDGANCIIKNTGDAQNPKFDYLLLAGNKVSSIPANITKIGYRGFQNNLSQSLTIPKSITEIGSYAFIDCVNLEQITFDPQIQIKTIGINTFNTCIKLKSISIPDSVETIGTSAFSKCIALEKVVLPNSLKQLNFGCFNGCIALKEVSELPAGLEEIESNPFQSCYSLEKISVNVGNTHFFSSKDGNNYNAICQKYSDDYTLVISALPTSIFPKNSILGADAMAGCIKLKQIDLSNVVMVLNRCFDSCSFLETVTNTNNLVYIGASAFASCESLKQISLPNIIELRSKAFYHCTALTNVDLSSAELLSVLPSSCFGQCTALTDVKLPGNLYTIQDHAFSHCDNLKTIDIPDSVVTMEERVFLECYNLTNVNISENSALETLDMETFGYCLSLKNITIPKNVKIIHISTFEACVAMTDAYFKDPNNWHYQGQTEKVDPALLSDPKKAATFLVKDMPNNIVKG